MRGWFKFSIRDLLWLAVVASLALGWWIDRDRLVNQLSEAQESADTAWHQLSHP